MSTKPKNSPVPNFIHEPLSIKDMAAILVKHYGIHTGHYDIMIEFKIGVGAMGPDPENTLPGAMIGISSFALVPSTVIGPLSVDASKVNPKNN